MYLLIDFILIISDNISKNVVHTSAVFRYILAFFQSHLSLDINYSLQFCYFLKFYQIFCNFSNQRNNRKHEVSRAVSLQVISLKEFRLK